MSDLTLGLAVVGGFALAAILAHGAWTLHRNTPKSSIKSAGKAKPQPHSSSVSEPHSVAITTDVATEKSTAESLIGIKPSSKLNAKSSTSQEAAVPIVPVVPAAPLASQATAVLADTTTIFTTSNKKTSKAAGTEKPAQNPAEKPADKAKVKPFEKQPSFFERISDALLPSDESELDKLAKRGQGAQELSAALEREALDADVQASDTPQTPAAEPTALSSEPKMGQIDVLIDSVAVLNPAQPVYGQAAMAAYPSSWRCGSKAFMIEGQNLRSLDWELPVANQSYSAFQAAVQLANRSGALNEIEFSEFVMKVNHFADKVNAQVDFPDMLEEVARAKELDYFASGHDVQLGFVIQSEAGGWTLGYIQDHAAALGFVLGATPGKMVLMPLEQDQTTIKSSSKPGFNSPLIHLVTDAQAAMSETQERAIASFSLVLDAPHAPQELKPFLTLCAMATQLAKSLEGKIVDDQGEEINTQGMAVIASGLERFYAALAERDFTAGSALAKRLFS